MSKPPTLLSLIAVLTVAAAAIAHEGDDDPGKVHACVRKKGGRMRVVEVGSKRGCKKKERALHFDIAGPAGASGATGPAGAAGTPAWERACPPDSVRVGRACVDRFEGSLWTIPPGNAALVDQLKAGTAALADLTAGGGMQVGAGFGLAPIPATFPHTGNWTAPVYAASVAGVLPTSGLSWSQAEQACALVDKQLATNQEWQRAAAGTPDPGTADDGATTCVTSSANPAPTGSRSACVSNWGAYDMVGNVNEWVADWDEESSGGTNWPSAYGDDESGVGNGSSALPAAWNRGGDWNAGTDAGIFSIRGAFNLTEVSINTGFRCAR
jgi:Sulfatase-modifying factor enzyme 1